MGERLEIPITVHFHECESRFHAYCDLTYPADGEVRHAHMDEWAATREIAAQGLSTTLRWFLHKHGLATGEVELQWT